MYPIRFEPIYQDYVWGGDRIAHQFQRRVPKGPIAESWELSDREEAMSVVANGTYKGKTIRELLELMGEDLIGHGQTFDRFPLLLKVIDAKENLSIQVHPDVEKALELKVEPKTEMWVVLVDGASVYAGLKQGVDEAAFKQAIRSKQAEELVEKIDLKRGEAVLVPAGRVHGICAGSFLYEIQQNSNTTYRLYDWDRKGRELHLKEGMACIHWQDLGHAKSIPHHESSDFHHQIILLGSSPFYVVERIDVFDHYHIAAIPKTFQILFCMHGEGEITVDSVKEPFHYGMTYLIPASAKSIEIEGKCEALRVRLP